MKTLKIVWTTIAGLVMLVIIFYYFNGQISATTAEQQIVSSSDTTAWFLGVIAVTLIISMFNGSPKRLETPKQ